MSMPPLDGRGVKELAGLFKTSLSDAYGLVLSSVRHWRLFVMATLKKDTQDFLRVPLRGLLGAKPGSKSHTLFE